MPVGLRCRDSSAGSGQVPDRSWRGRNAGSRQGETALAFAMRHGRTLVLDLLMRAGAKPSEVPAEASGEAAADAAEIKPAPAHTAREAVERSLPLLQRNDEEFMQKSGCVSCHNNTLTAMSPMSAPPGPQDAVEEIRKLSGVKGVALFGKALHVIADDGEAAARSVKESLPKKAFQVERIEKIVPSMQDVFVSLIQARDHTFQ